MKGTLKLFNSLYPSLNHPTLGGGGLGGPQPYYKTCVPQVKRNKKGAKFETNVKATLKEINQYGRK